MDIVWIITIFCLGFIGSFVSGMLGIGGAIINFPMLLYIPPLLGFEGFSAHEVSGISAIQVLFAALAGVWVYRKGGYLNKSLILYMGSAVLMGSFVGSFGSKFLSGSSINIVYGILAIIAAVMMFIPKKQIDDKPMREVTFNKLLAVLLAFIVGVGSGVVGGDRWVFISANYACYSRHSNADDDCNEPCDYIYLLDWRVNWQGDDRSSCLLSSAYYDYSEPYCGSSWRKSG